MVNPIDIDQLLRQWIELRRQGVRPREVARRLSSQIHGLIDGIALAVQCAIAECFPEHWRPELQALCVSERAGNTRGDIACALMADSSGRMRLDGHKAFVTLGNKATRLLVAAALFGPDEQQAGVRIAILPANTPGVTIRPVHSSKSPPELPHSELDFQSAVVEAVLEGDAYHRYLKRFRVIEDIYLYAVACFTLHHLALQPGWRRDHSSDLICLGNDLLSLLDTDLLKPAAVLSSENAFSRADALFADVVPHLTDPLVQAHWTQHIGLIYVGHKARRARLKKALAQQGEPDSLQ